MIKKYWVNGKVTYPQADTALTTFTFTSEETGEIFALSTSDQAEADAITYGDRVILEVRKNTEPAKQ